MRRRKLFILAYGAVFAVGMAVVAPVGHASHDDEDLFLRGDITEVMHDRDHAGRWSEGDRIDFDFELFDVRDDHRFAADGDGECVVTDVEFSAIERADCEVEVDHVDGRLFLEGDIEDDEAFEGEQVITFRVEDGTRHFDDDEGEAHFFFEDEFIGEETQDPRERDCDTDDDRDRREGCRGIDDDVDNDFTMFIEFDR